MNIVEINTVNKYSTGKIMTAICECAISRGHNVLRCYPDSRTNSTTSKKYDYVIGNRYIRQFWIYVSSFIRCEYIIHLISTLLLIRRIYIFKPDLIHIHNLHSSYINLPLFFNYLRRDKIKLMITQHDCWTFTGHCPYYSYSNCNKWETLCYDCKIYKEYPKSNWDNSKYMYVLKKKLLTNSEATIVSVSRWLANETKRSFLKHHPIYVISNGVNRNVFKPIHSSTIDKLYGLKGKFVILGCATGWSDRKGFADFIKLSQILHNDEVIVLLGVEPKRLMPAYKNVLLLPRTENQEQLAEFYTRANVTLSLSKAETFGLTIIESMSCGTPVVVYNNTAQPELVNGRNGFVAKDGDIESVRECIDRIKQENYKDLEKACLSTSICHDQEIIYNKYINIMEKIN